MCRTTIVEWASKDNLLCKVAANERNENLFSNCRVQHNLCKVAANECNENLFSNCRVQHNLCKVAANECNENLFSNCRVQDNLCKVTTFFSLIGVTLCLCCFLAQNAYILSLPSYAVLFCMNLIETHTSSFSFLNWDKVTISFAAALHTIFFSLCSGAESEAYSVLFPLLFFSKVYVFALVLFKNLLVHSLGCATVDNHFARFACALRPIGGRSRGGVVELAHGLAHGFYDTPKR